VISILLAFRGLARAIIAVWRDPETKALPVVAGALVLTGTIFYWRFEDWTFIQALYFSVLTLTTVGYGDLTRRPMKRGSSRSSTSSPASACSSPCWVRLLRTTSG
jgi:voltage-gated potassium channel Kch